MPPVEHSVLSKGNRAGQLHRLARKKTQMLGGLLAAPRLVEQATAGAHHAVAADHPVIARDAACLCSSKVRGNCGGVAEPGLDGILVDGGFHRGVHDSSSIKHLAPNCAGRGEDQSQSNNLVEKRGCKANAALGRGSTGELRTARQWLFEDSSTGRKSIPRL